MALAVDAPLSVLWLGANQIRARGAEALAEGLSGTKALKEIRMPFNNIGDEGVKAICEALTRKEVQVSDCESQTQRQEQTQDQEQVARLQILSLSHNHIGDTGATAAATLLDAQSELTSLDLDGNYIGCRGAEAIASKLSSNKSLQELRLASNRIGNQGLTALRNALSNNQTMGLLHIRNNDYDPSDGTWAAEDRWASPNR
eukprot:Selendium_serpulae@DN5716_c0_g1_i1.p2